MPKFVVRMKYSPVDCLLLSDENMAKFSRGVAKGEQAAKRYSLKVLTAVANPRDRVISYVLEAPSQTAVEEYLRYTGWYVYNDIAIRVFRPPRRASNMA